MPREIFPAVVSLPSPVVGAEIQMRIFEPNPMTGPDTHTLLIRDRQVSIDGVRGQRLDAFEVAFLRLLAQQPRRNPINKGDVERELWNFIGGDPTPVSVLVRPLTEKIGSLRPETLLIEGGPRAKTYSLNNDTTVIIEETKPKKALVKTAPIVSRRQKEQKTSLPHVDIDLRAIKMLTGGLMFLEHTLTYAGTPLLDNETFEDLKHKTQDVKISNRMSEIEYKKIANKIVTEVVKVFQNPEMLSRIEDRYGSSVRYLIEYLDRLTSNWKRSNLQRQQMLMILLDEYHRNSKYF